MVTRQEAHDSIRCLLAFRLLGRIAGIMEVGVRNASSIAQVLAARRLLKRTAFMGLWNGQGNRRSWTRMSSARFDAKESSPLQASGFHPICCGRAKLMIVRVSIHWF